MRRWKPKFAAGLWIGLVLVLLALTGIGLLLNRILGVLMGSPDTWVINLSLYRDLLGVVALLLVAGWLAYRVTAAFTLYYEIDRNGVYVCWLGNRAVIPLSQIERIDSGVPGAHMPWRVFQGIGYYWGRGRTAEGGPLYLFSTRQPAKALILQTDEIAYAISPRSQDAFVQDLEQRRKLGVVKPLAAMVETGRLFSYAFWNDRVVRWGLVIAVGLNLALLGILATGYPDLAPVIGMRFDAAGQITELRPRYQLLFFPLAALLLILLNLIVGLYVYTRTPFGSRLLQVASVVLQVLFGMALLAIMLG